MSLITETNAQYYSGQQSFDSSGLNSFKLQDLTTGFTGGLPVLSGSYNVVGTTTSGSGSGAEFLVTTDGSAQSILITVTSGGANYAVGDTIDLPSPPAGTWTDPLTITVQAFMLGGDTLTTDFNTALVATVPGVSNTNFSVVVNNIALVENTDYVLVNNNTVRLLTHQTAGTKVIIQLAQFAINNNYGNYSYLTLKDLIDNFLVGYVGEDKLLSRVKRADIMFHAKRGIQEFNYDVFKSLKSQELTIPPNLCVPFPQDYVNYINISWIDDNGGKHTIYPTRVTSAPDSLPIQDAEGIPIQDDAENNIEATQSITEERWDDQTLTKDFLTTEYDLPYREFNLGRRYGLQPEEANVNGHFVINDRLGCFTFTNQLVGKIIILEYISDGLAYDEDSIIPKLAEEALYMHIAYSILNTRKNVPEYIINRYKKNRRATMHNAKIRLSNIKTQEIAQVFRNKSKWIKH